VPADIAVSTAEFKYARVQFREYCLSRTTLQTTEANNELIRTLSSSVGICGNVGNADSSHCYNSQGTEVSSTASAV
jgi:hypothetical protein